MRPWIDRHRADNYAFPKAPEFPSKGRGFPVQLAGIRYDPGDPRRSDLDRYIAFDPAAAAPHVTAFRDPPTDPVHGGVRLRRDGRLRASRLRQRTVMTRHVGRAALGDLGPRVPVLSHARQLGYTHQFVLRNDGTRVRGLDRFDDDSAPRSPPRPASRTGGAAQMLTCHVRADSEQLQVAWPARWRCSWRTGTRRPGTTTR